MYDAPDIRSFFKDAPPVGRPTTQEEFKHIVQSWADTTISCFGQCVDGPIFQGLFSMYQADLYQMFSSLGPVEFPHILGLYQHMETAIQIAPDLDLPVNVSFVRVLVHTTISARGTLIHNTTPEHFCVEGRYNDLDISAVSQHALRHYEFDEIMSHRVENIRACPFSAGLFDAISRYRAYMNAAPDGFEYFTWQHKAYSFYDRFILKGPRKLYRLLA